MTKEMLTELEQGIESDVLRAIDETFETEAEYEEYILRERSRREKARKNKRRKELEKELESSVEENDVLDDSEVKDFELTKYTRRVYKIKKENSGYKKAFKIYFKDKYGEVDSDIINIGLPEDKSSQWVRLCDYVGVNPSYPTNLRGKIIPVKVSKNDEISVPPIQKGLNPITYKYNRKIKKLFEKPKISKLKNGIIKTFPFWGSIMGILISLFFVIMTRNVTAESLTVITLPIYLLLVFLSAIMLVSSTVYAIKSWFTLIISVFLVLYDDVVIPKFQKVYRKAFPK